MMTKIAKKKQFFVLILYFPSIFKEKHAVSLL